MLTVKITQDTWAKLKPLASKDLSEWEKVSLKKGDEFTINDYCFERKHVKIHVSKLYAGFPDWFLFAEHIQILQDGKVIFPETCVKLKVPYKSQLNNVLNPHGSCNVTSIAMCLDFLGVERKTNKGQFEDELYQYAEDNGLSRHSPQDLKKIVEDYGVKDNFTVYTDIYSVQQWLRQGNPCVVHGYFTSFGHIVVLVGYDNTGFLVHDPYGEWTSNGYIRNSKENPELGKYQHYSYDLIQRTCIPDGEFWVHFISK